MVLYNKMESHDNLEFQVAVRNLEIYVRKVNPANITLWSSKTYAIISSHHKWVKHRRRTAIFFLRSIYSTKTTSLLWAFCVWWATAVGRENVIICRDILFNWPRLQLLSWSLRTKKNPKKLLISQYWCRLGEVRYCFSRSAVKFQGHTAKTIVHFDLKLAVSGWIWNDAQSFM